jgi:hypothetical protein
LVEDVIAFTMGRDDITGYKGPIVDYFNDMIELKDAIKGWLEVAYDSIAYVYIPSKGSFVGVFCDTSFTPQDACDAINSKGYDRLNSVTPDQIEKIKNVGQITGILGG